MNASSPTARVAVVQAAPILFDIPATLEKMHSLVREAAEQEAQFLLFPEAFLPLYPRGFTFGMAVGSRSAEGRDLFRRLYEASVEVPGPVTDTIGEMAKEAGVAITVGVIERENPAISGTLYCTLLYFSSEGILLGKHRKLKPTGSERLIWGDGAGDDLTVYSTPLGRIGGLICWENYMPLARMALYTQNVQIYLAPTADARDSWQSTIRHIACEGRCFVLACNQFVTRDQYPPDVRTHPDIPLLPETVCRGGSAIVSPLGEYLAGPLFDREGILYAGLDLADLHRAKLDFDPVGHYARPDVLEFRWKGNPQRNEET